MKTKIYQDGDFVVIEYNDYISDERVKREFYAQRGSVYEVDGYGRGRDAQVCYGLSHHGDTLNVRIGGSDLLATIRGEWPTLRRAMAAF